MFPKDLLQNKFISVVLVKIVVNIIYLYNMASRINGVDQGFYLLGSRN